MTKMVNVKVNGRWDILLPEHRAARPEWTSEAGWEKARLNRIYHDIYRFKDKKERAPIMYYVGAEEGDMCALIQMWGAELVMFEPNGLVWPNIKAIWDANGLTRPKGLLAGFAGTIQRVVSTPGTWWSNLNADKDTWPECAYGATISDHGFKNLCEDNGEIPIYKIDNCHDRLGVPDMISIDVEGAEWEVLRGAESTLKEHHPIIYLSLHPEFLYEIYKEYSADLRHWLKQLGYKETLLDYQHEVHLVYEKGE